jgi:hypothetical protein
MVLLPLYFNFLGVFVVLSFQIFYVGVNVWFSWFFFFSKELIVDWTNVFDCSFLIASLDSKFDLIIWLSVVWYMLQKRWQTSFKKCFLKKWSWIFIEKKYIQFYSLGMVFIIFLNSFYCVVGIFLRTLHWNWANT